jgi:DNA-directed RNA polymerase subunit RPC12/RpoP
MSSIRNPIGTRLSIAKCPACGLPYNIVDLVRKSKDRVIRCPTCNAKVAEVT